MAKDVEFEFDIVVSLPKGAGDEDAIMDALFEAGCDDAVVGLGASGLVGLGFTRGGQDAEVVISAAVKQVLSALPKGAQLREVKPEFILILPWNIADEIKEQNAELAETGTRFVTSVPRLSIE